MRRVLEYDMTNVVQLPQRKPALDFITVPIDISSPLEDGDLVAGQFGRKGPVQLDWWSPPDGRGHGGRFCKRGSEDECACLGPMRYWPRDLERGCIKILGKCRPGILKGMSRSLLNLVG